MSSMIPNVVRMRSFGSTGSEKRAVSCRDASMVKSPCLKVVAHPPISVLRSSTRTRLPARAYMAAAVRPPRPEPIAIASKSKPTADSLAFLRRTPASNDLLAGGNRPLVAAGSRPGN